MAFSSGQVKRPRGINIGDPDRGRVTRFRASYNDRLVARLPLGGTVANQPLDTINIRKGGRGGRGGQRRG